LYSFAHLIFGIFLFLLRRGRTAFFLELKILISSFLLTPFVQTLRINLLDWPLRLSLLKNIHLILTWLFLVDLLLQIDDDVAEEGGIAEQRLLDHVLGLD
jgi:hypothetical protein